MITAGIVAGWTACKTAQGVLFYYGQPDDWGRLRFALDTAQGNPYGLNLGKRANYARVMRLYRNWVGYGA